MSNMYNKCSKCGKLIERGDETRIVPDSRGGLQVLCMNCYADLYGGK